MNVNKDNNSEYLRVGTNYFRKVISPMINNRTQSVLIEWNAETIKQDNGKNFLASISKYKGFCFLPSHIDYWKSKDGF